MVVCCYDCCLPRLFYTHLHVAQLVPVGLALVRRARQHVGAPAQHLREELAHGQVRAQDGGDHRRARERLHLRSSQPAQRATTVREDASADVALYVLISTVHSWRGTQSSNHAIKQRETRGQNVLAPKRVSTGGIQVKPQGSAGSEG